MLCPVWGIELRIRLDAYTEERRKIVKFTA